VGLSLRWQTPSYAPINVTALLAGVLAEVRQDDRGEHEVLDRMRQVLSAGRCVAADSGTSALRLALVAAAAGRERRPALLPAWACYDVLTAALGAGTPVAFYDVDPSTLQPVRGSFEQALRLEPCAVVLVHAFGIPVAVPLWADLARRAGALVVEDAAQAWGAEYEGRPAGAWGDAAIFSFGRGKGITGGRGGMLAFRHEDRFDAVSRALRGARRPRGLHDIFIAASQWVFNRPGLYAVPAHAPGLRLGQTKFRPPAEPGLPSCASLAMVASAWNAAVRETARRRATTARLSELLASATDRVRAITPDSAAAPSWLRYPVLVEGGRRDALRAAGEHLGIAASYPRALPDLARGTNCPVHDSRDTFEGARQLASCLLTLPTHRWVVKRDLMHLAEWVVAAGSRQSA
jgi:dTDP-4-amino-4,6-dideoxygalactose transaminase